MPGAQKNFIGREGFIWWIGVVEDRQDPEQLGRVRVRCFGWHTEDKELVPTNLLPWAHTVLPVNHPGAYTPKEGDMVMGFFMDGMSAQNPVVVGVIPGKPSKKPKYDQGFSDPRTNLSSAPKKPSDSAEAYPKGKYLKESTFNRLSRGKSQSTVIETRKKNRKSSIKSAGGVTWAEPNSSFAPIYPYNNAIETESGHVFELDDTPNNERIQLAHRNGSYIEIDKDGNRLERIQKDHYSITMGSDHVYISGKCSVTIDGDYNIRVGGNMNVEVAGQINMSAAKDIRIKGLDNYVESTGKTNIKSTGEANFASGKKLSLRGATAALQGSTVDIPAAQINMQSGSATMAAGTGLTGGSSATVASEAAAAANAAANTASTGGTGVAGAIDGVLSGVTSAVTAVAGAVTGAVAGAVSAVTGAVAGAVGAVTDAVGKTIDGITASVSGATQQLKGELDGAIKSLDSNSPLGQIQAKVTELETSINNKRGEILGLTGTEKGNVLGKIDQVIEKSAAKNITFDIDQDIKTEINKSKNIPQEVTVTGKRVYPKTETVTKTTTSELITADQTNALLAIAAANRRSSNTG